MIITRAAHAHSSETRDPGVRRTGKQTIKSGQGPSDHAGRNARRLIGWGSWGEGSAVNVSAWTVPQKSLCAKGRSGARRGRKASRVLLKDYQSARLARGVLDRERPVTHDPLRLCQGGLRWDGGLEKALVKIRTIEVHHFEDHEDSDGCKGYQKYHPPSRRP